jgi:predicted transcriptional regulator
MLSQPVSKGTVAGSDMDVDEANLWSSAPPGSYVASFREIIRSYAGDCCLNLPLLIDAFDNMAYDDVIICHFSGTVMRTIVDLPDKQIEALKQLGKSVHSSRAELVRRAIDEYLARHLPALDDDAFGLWEKRKTDGVIYQEHARDEWDK